MSDTGWFRDPFDEHEARWLSDGHPTELVRDEGTEDRDEPPAESFDGAPEALPEADDASAVAGGADLLRADAATRVDQSVEARDEVDAAELAAGQAGPAG